jgi:DNA (cytosine-5)-methyltransferase 1
MIRVVDVFAGPGGLNEGFSSIRTQEGLRAFDVTLSMEMESFAFETLRLRSFYRQFEDRVPELYYDHLRGRITRSELYGAFPDEYLKAERECWQVTLGPKGRPTREVRDRISTAIGDEQNWVLIGGPPCQAYSLAGRSRNLGNPEYNARKDVRQKLYVEYLQILADHRPAVFVMENVKGLLSAKLGKTGLFHRILDDLRDPAAAIRRENRSALIDSASGYRIWSLVERQMFDNGTVEGSVIRSEKYGIPQARHRVILLGIRDDISVTPGVLKPATEMTVDCAIRDLPKVRSGLSKLHDSPANWRTILRSQSGSRWANAGTGKAGGDQLRSMITETLRGIEPPAADRGAEFVAGEPALCRNGNWFVDSRLDGFCNHSTRGHMESDLHRYLYASCFAKLNGRSPTLGDFPTDLIPDHGSADNAIADGGNFSDRFRVQVATRPSTTIVSHISKDGHYYIHPDPMQCRSLTGCRLFYPGGVRRRGIAMAKTNEWTRDQLLMALRLYMRTSFGRLHGKNPEIIALAAKIGRTPGALAMKASNFASIDPKLNRKGLANASQADRDIWNDFESNPTRLAVEAEEAAARFKAPSEGLIDAMRLPKGMTEKESLVKVRRVQSFFRAAVMISYESRCAISGIAIPELLVASHIIPWSVSEDRRADPTNGIFLNAIFDQAFDRGFISIDDSYRVLVAEEMVQRLQSATLTCSLLEIPGRKLKLPKRFVPDPAALDYHRKHIYKKT